MDESRGVPPRRRWRRQWTEEVEKPTSPEQTQPTTEELPLTPEWTTVVLEVKVPACKDRIPIEMDVNNTVLKLKEKVLEQEEMYPVPVDRVVLQSHTTHVELLDRQMLKDCAVFGYPDNEIDVYLKPPPRKLKVTVLPMNSRERIEIEVNAEDTVAVLREKLEQVHRRVRFRLPTRGRYFFIHELNPMDERMSFRWHKVQNGDTIETFDGYLVEDACAAEDDD
ncbi:hypothetical protein E2542_SST22616 [Spatholobus suberectus]|nr:hypothetical protein E2542_SST22616 [Spatholobus suberectus]